MTLPEESAKPPDFSMVLGACALHSSLDFIVCSATSRASSTAM